MELDVSRFQRVALVHDWLVAQRGGENVLLELARMFPGAPIYTVVHAPGRVHPEIEDHPIYVSRIQNLPGSPRYFRRYLPLFPKAVEAWDLGAYDLIISTSHCVAKGVLTHHGQTHLAYIHTPMRYLWDQLPHYLPNGRTGQLLRPLAERLAEPLRRWDVRSAQRPTVLLANSAHVARRIAQVWQRGSTVLYPPVDVDYYAQGPRLSQRHGWLAVSALVPYKRLDLAIRLANSRGLRLTVIGDGTSRRALERLAGPTITFRQGLHRDELRKAYGQAAGLIFCGTEDFGIVPVEAMAAGCPILAYGTGGLCETVVGEGPNATGAFFHEPTVAAMSATLRHMEARRRGGAFAAAILQRRARLFSRAAFVDGFAAAIKQAVRARERRVV